MKNSRIARISVTVIFAIMLLQLVLAKPVSYKKIERGNKSMDLINAHDDLIWNMEKAKKATHLTIHGGEEECNPREINNVIVLIRTLKGTKKNCITLQNLEMISNYDNDETGEDVRSNSIRISKQQAFRNHRMRLAAIEFIRFLDVSPSVMLVILRKFSFGELSEIQIKSTYNNALGLLSELHCANIKRLILRNLPGPKKPNALKYNSIFEAENDWEIFNLEILGNRKILIPPWLLKRVTNIAILNLRQYLFLPEIATKKLSAENIFITNANKMRKKELEAGIKKRKIEKIERISRNKKNKCCFQTIQK